MQHFLRYTGHETVWIAQGIGKAAAKGSWAPERGPEPVAGRNVGASVPSVFRWRQAYEREGEGALAAKAVPGRPRKLDPKECKRLVKILLSGALASGFPNEAWLLRRIAQVIEKEFDVEYHPSHLWRVLQRLGWSCQIPERRAIQRDEEELRFPSRSSERTWVSTLDFSKRTSRPSTFSSSCARSFGTCEAT